MPRIDEHTQVRQRLGSLTGPEPPQDPDELVPGPPHAGHWDDDALDPPERPAAREGAYGQGAGSPAWVGEPGGGMAAWHERLVPQRVRGTRWDPGHRGALVLAGVGLTVVLVAGVVSLRERPVAQAVPSIAAVRTEALSTAEPGQLTAAPGSANPEGGAPSTVAAPPGSRDPSGGPTGINGHPAASELVVSVIGMVERGGLLRFPAGARVADALTAASPRADADLSGLNLAQHLADGDQIVIGKTGPRPDVSQVGSTIVGAAPPSPTGAAASGTSQPSGVAKKVDLNTATEADLEALPGVGPVTARAILGWRTQHGRFTSIDQLADIDGIGPARLAKLRVLVTI
ncbi:ComEA family DNA-binding protein [Nocardia uniformis]|uniref:ComEA family DNA-binding protein n=1 Tax=Nocardia uniformis TaxID=53432 RepID=A0A849CCP9_9NOCA|nr:ComEA family DNA-binding protein [Nocardia uniformis]NNH74200.1 ComEA family DNA-binding protein [Nocardia uniformis]